MIVMSCQDFSLPSTNMGIKACTMTPSFYRVGTRTLETTVLGRSQDP